MTEEEHLRLLGLTNGLKYAEDRNAELRDAGFTLAIELEYFLRKAHGLLPAHVQQLIQALDQWNYAVGLLPEHKTAVYLAEKRFEVAKQVFVDALRSPFRTGFIQKAEALREAREALEEARTNAGMTSHGDPD